MKTFIKITALFAVLFVQTAIFSQSNVNEHAVKFDPSNSQNAFLVGENGVILKSTDIGLTWTAQESGVTNTLYGVAIVDENTSFAVGENGLILKTADGGSSWNVVPSGVLDNFKDVEISTEGYVVICGDNGVI